jgi:hypothetical protein
MSDPMQTSSRLEERDDSPTSSTIEGVRARLVPVLLWLLERLGTGMLFLVVISLIVIQTTAVVSHWYGKQAADQTEQFLCFMLVGITVLGSGYLAFIGLRKWRPVAHLPAPHPPEPVDSPKGIDDPIQISRAHKTLMRIFFIFFIVTRASPGILMFSIMIGISTVLYLLWLRRICPDWKSAVSETFLILVLGMALRVWKDSLQPPVPVKQRPLPAVHQEGIPPSGVAISSIVHSRRNSSCPDFQKS